MARRYKRRGGGRVIKKNPNRINREITAEKVRLVGDNVEDGVYNLKKALDISNELELDLVEIAAKADPPVCRIVDYKKFLYDKKKKEKEIKSKTQKTVIKEIRFGPNTDEHDVNFKRKHAIKFLQEGSKVKAYVFFRGRSIVFKERGELLLLQFAESLKEYGTLEQMPSLEKKRMTIFIAPKK